jgi:hypothetical protein
MPPPTLVHVRLEKCYTFFVDVLDLPQGSRLIRHLLQLYIIQIYQAYTYALNVDFSTSLYARHTCPRTTLPGN